jgi:hypothetical protein
MDLDSGAEIEITGLEADHKDENSRRRRHCPFSTLEMETDGLSFLYSGQVPRGWGKCKHWVEYTYMNTSILEVTRCN